MMISRTVLGYDIQMTAIVDPDSVFVFALCPICLRREESYDNGHGVDHAANLIARKLKTHLIRSHGVEDDGEPFHSL